MDLLQKEQPTVEPEHIELEEYQQHLENYLYDEFVTHSELWLYMEEPIQQILKNADLHQFNIRRLGEEPIEEIVPIEDILDDRLRIKIEQYNRINRNSKERDRNRSKRRRKQDGQGKPQRKVRTTITSTKLEQMNRIFKDYLQNQQKLKEEAQTTGVKIENRDKDNLKSIGEKLGLGYSTILHKFRQFRATQKVKGGVLIAAVSQKRKYKKSRDIEELIQKALQKHNFYTAVELSEYLSTTHSKKLSRSIVSRHLGQLGFSMKNTKEKAGSYSPSACKIQLQQKFTMALNAMRHKYQSKVYYIKEFAFSLAGLKQSNQISEDSSNQFMFGTAYMTVLASTQKLLKFQINHDWMSKQQYYQFMNAMGAHRMIVLDMENSSAYCDKVLELRGALESNRSIKLFYMPPKSKKLNLLYYLEPKISEYMKTMPYTDLSDFQIYLGEYMQSIMDNSLDQLYQKLQESEQKSLSQALSD